MAGFKLSEALIGRMADGMGVRPGTAMLQGIQQGQQQVQQRTENRQVSQQLELENKRADATAANQAETLRIKQKEFAMSQKEFVDKQALAKREEERLAVKEKSGRDFQASYKNSGLPDHQISALDAMVDSGDIEGAADEFIKFKNFGKLTPEEQLEADRKAQTYADEQADRVIAEEERQFKVNQENAKIDAVYNTTVQTADEKIGLVNDVLGQMFDEETGEFIDNPDGNNLVVQDNVGYFDKFFAGNIQSQSSEGELLVKLETITSGLILTELTELKATGATLGQITEKELQVLKTASANIEQASSPEVLKSELIKVRDAMVKIKQNLKTHPPLKAGVKPTIDGYYSGDSSNSTSTPYDDEEANSIYNLINGKG